ncbi:MAG: hypothetical protein AAGE52_12125 [Myxococcota bacterium]
MAKKKKAKLPERADPTEALGQLERPSMNWKVIAQFAIGLGVIWLIAGLVSPYISYWGYVVAGVLTVLLLGLGFYVWRMMRKSSAIVDVLRGATDAEGRAAAIAALKDGDAMSKMAQAQLVAQEDPKEALAILESIDLKKTPKLLQNDVRAQLAMMYLLQNRAQDARALADDIKLDAQPQPKQKAMYAAVMSESFARTGKAKEAAKLLEDYDPDDADYAEMKPLLYRASIFTWLKLKKRGRARTAMMRLAKHDANQLGAFLQKGTHPEVQRLAREVLEKEGLVPKQRVKMRMR